MPDCIPIQHRVLSLGDIHGIANWQFPTEQSRLDFTGPFVSTDIHKVAYVQSSQQYYILNGISPISWTTFSVPTVVAVNYNTVSRNLVINLSDGTVFNASLSDIYTYADSAADAARTSAITAAVQQANTYTDSQVQAINNVIDGIISSINSIISALQPDYKTITEDYTLELDDANRLLVVDSSDPVVITIPSEDDESLGIGFVCHVDRRGTGTVTFAASGNDTLEFAGTSPEIAAQFAAVSVARKFYDDVSGDTVWGLYGRLPQ